MWVERLEWWGIGPLAFALPGQVAQLVEQRTENPRVGGSIPSLAMPLSVSPVFNYNATATQNWVAVTLYCVRIVCGIHGDAGQLGYSSLPIGLAPLAA